MITAKLLRVFAFVPFALVLLVCFTQAAQEAAVPSAASSTDIKISFKMNTSVTRGMYMGDRWISPPTYYNVEEGKEITVEAAAKGLDAQGKLIDINAAWEAGDPAMMTISPDKGPKVKLTIRKSGRTNLTVTAGGVSRKLPVKAWYKDKAMNVEINQK